MPDLPVFRFVPHHVWVPRPDGCIVLKTEWASHRGILFRMLGLSYANLYILVGW